MLITSKFKFCIIKAVIVQYFEYAIEISVLIMQLLCNQVRLLPPHLLSRLFQQWLIKHGLKFWLVVVDTFRSFQKHCTAVTHCSCRAAFSEEGRSSLPFMMPIVIIIKTHSSVVRANGNEYIIRSKKVAIFTRLYIDPWCLIQGAPNLLWKCPLIRGGYIPNLKEIVPAVSKIQVTKVSVFSSFFLQLFTQITKLDLTHKHVLQSSWNLVHL